MKGKVIHGWLTLIVYCFPFRFFAALETGAGLPSVHRKPQKVSIKKLKFWAGTLTVKLKLGSPADHVIRVRKVDFSHFFGYHHHMK